MCVCVREREFSNCTSKCCPQLLSSPRARVCVHTCGLVGVWVGVQEKEGGEDVCACACVCVVTTTNADPASFVEWVRERECVCACGCVCVCVCVCERERGGVGACVRVWHVRSKSECEARVSRRDTSTRKFTQVQSCANYLAQIIEISR